MKIKREASIKKKFKRKNPLRCEKKNPSMISPDIKGIENDTFLPEHKEPQKATAPNSSSLISDTTLILFQ